MILRIVKEALVRRGEATVSELAAETGRGKEEVETGLDYWIRKGKIRIKHMNTDRVFVPLCSFGCSAAEKQKHSCCSEGSSGTVSTVYEWDSGN